MTLYSRILPRFAEITIILEVALVNKWNPKMAVALLNCFEIDCRVKPFSEQCDSSRTNNDGAPTHS